MKGILSFCMAPASPASATTFHYDLVVYGATAGGMATGGLSRTDTGTREVIGGLAPEF